MEKSVEWQFDAYMQDIFQMQEADAKAYSPLALAYIGDSIYDLIIKTLVLSERASPPPRTSLSQTIGGRPASRPFLGICI